MRRIIPYTAFPVHLHETAFRRLSISSGARQTGVERDAGAFRCWAIMETPPTADKTLPHRLPLVGCSPVTSGQAGMGFLAPFTTSLCCVSGTGDTTRMRRTTHLHTHYLPSLAALRGRSCLPLSTFGVRANSPGVRYTGLGRNWTYRLCSRLAGACPATRGATSTGVLRVQRCGPP